MNIWNTVFLVLIFLLAAVVLFFTAQEYSKRSQAQQILIKFEEAIEKEKAKATAARDGSEPRKTMTEKSIDEMSLGELIDWVRLLRIERKKTWFGCNIRVTPDAKRVTAPPLGDGNPAAPADQLKTIRLVEVNVIVTGPTVLREGNEEVIRPDDMQGAVYLFDEGKEGVGGAFLGRFTVVSPQPSRAQGGYVVTLHAVDELNEAEIQRLNRAARSTCAVYVSMPEDRYDFIFDNLSPEEAAELISDAKLRQRMLDPERPLVDYDEIYTRKYADRTRSELAIDLTKRQNAGLVEDQRIATEEDAQLRKEIDLEKTRIAAMVAQAGVLQDKLDEYKATGEFLMEKIDEQRAENERMRAAIADIMQRVAEKISRQAEEARSGIAMAPEAMIDGEAGTASTGDVEDDEKATDDTEADPFR